MKLLKRLLISISLATPLLLVTVSFLPATAAATVDPSCDNTGYFLGLPAWYAYLDIGLEDNDKCAVIGPKDPSTGSLDWQKAIPLIALAILELMLRLSGTVAVVFVLYGGFKYITSQGEPEKTKTSRQTITNSLIGLVISIVAAAAVSFIANTLTTR